VQPTSPLASELVMGQEVGDALLTVGVIATLVNVVSSGPSQRLQDGTE